jgi:hypothetical protein
MYLREIGWGCVNWIAVAQDRDKWRALVNAVVGSFHISDIQQTSVVKQWLDDRISVGMHKFNNKGTVAIGVLLSVCLEVYRKDTICPMWRWVRIPQP